MGRIRTIRSFAVLTLLCIAIQLLDFAPALAGDGSVRGSVRTSGGQLPPGALVKATSLTGGAASTAAIGADGRYEFPKLPEGPYVFEAVDKDGKPLGQGHNTLVPPRPFQMDLFVALGPAAAGTEGRKKESRKKAAAGAPIGMSKAKTGLLLGAAFAVGVGGGFILDDENKQEEESASPSTP